MSKKQEAVFGETIGLLAVMMLQNLQNSEYADQNL